MNPHVKAFFDESTNTVTYVASDHASKQCAIIDPVLDFDQASGRVSTSSADVVIEFLTANEYEVVWILETHAHADHLSAAQYLKVQTGGKTGIGRHITRTQQIFRETFNLGDEFQPDGRQFDHLLDEGDVLEVGGLQIRVMHTPGHTPACVTYLAEDAAFVGDTLFMPDFGTARVDFPGGDAATLYQSIQRLYELPAQTRLFTCHDYKAPGREYYAWQSTVAEQRAANVHIREGVSEQEFIEFRTARDATLGVPKLMLPSIQVNIRAGKMPPAEDNGVAYLKLPIDAI